MHPNPKIGGQTCKKKRRVYVNTDRISELPDALLIHILSFVPTIVVVGTCVLSKRWRSLWKHVPKLDYHYLNDRTQLRLSPQFVNRFLLLYKSPLLESLRLIVDSNCDAVDIGIWIEYAVERGLRELELDPYSEKGFIQLPSTIYACKTLEVLKLKSYVRVDVPDSTICFKSLKILNLQLVYYKDDDSVRRLFSSCPNLEDLVVKRYIDNVINFTIAVPSLKRLSIHDCSDGDGRRGYVIDAPSLNYLSIKGLKDFKFSLEHMPKLREAKTIDLSNIDTGKILLPLASSVKRLSLSFSPLEVNMHPFEFTSFQFFPEIEVLLLKPGRVKKGLVLELEELWLNIFSRLLVPQTKYATSIIFQQLVYLELTTTKTEWWNLLEILLLNSPNLQVLKLREGHRKFSKENAQYCKPINVPPCLLFYLQKLEWERYNGQREEEREVATYILTNAKHLKEASFSTSKYFTSDDKLEMLKELAREPRASPSCQLFFK